MSATCNSPRSVAGERSDWNTVKTDSGIPANELRKFVDHSYQLVAASLPKARRVKLRTGDDILELPAFKEK